MGPAHAASVDRWTIPSVMAAINNKVVYRTAALLPNLFAPRGAFRYDESSLAGRSAPGARIFPQIFEYSNSHPADTSMSFASMFNDEVRSHVLMICCDCGDMSWPLSVVGAVS